MDLYKKARQIRFISYGHLTICMAFTVWCTWTAYAWIGLGILFLLFLGTLAIGWRIGQLEYQLHEAEEDVLNEALNNIFKAAKEAPKCPPSQLH